MKRISILLIIMVLGCPSRLVGEPRLVLDGNASNYKLVKLEIRKLDGDRIVLSEPGIPPALRTKEFERYLIDALKNEIDFINNHPEDQEILPGMSGDYAVNLSFEHLQRKYFVGLTFSIESDKTITDSNLDPVIGEAARRERERLRRYILRNISVANEVKDKIPQPEKEKVEVDQRAKKR